MAKIDKKKLISIIAAVIVSLIIIAVPLAIKLATTDKTQPPTDDDFVENTTPAEITVTISIVCTNLYLPSYSNYLEDVKKSFGDEQLTALNNGIILEKTTCKIDMGSTVMDLTKKVAKENNIQLTIENNIYISAINGLAEKMAGGQSGWMYNLNGGYAMGANSVRLKEGDDVVWWYTITPKDKADTQLENTSKTVNLANIYNDDMMRGVA